MDALRNWIMPIFKPSVNASDAVSSGIPSVTVEQSLTTTAVRVQDVVTPVIEALFVPRPIIYKPTSARFVEPEADVVSSTPAMFFPLVNNKGDVVRDGDLEGSRSFNEETGKWSYDKQNGVADTLTKLMNEVSLDVPFESIVVEMNGYVFGVAYILINGEFLDILKDKEHIQEELDKMPRPEVTIARIASYGLKATFEDNFLTERPAGVVKLLRQYSFSWSPDGLPLITSKSSALDVCKDSRNNIVRLLGSAINNDPLDTPLNLVIEVGGYVFGAANIEIEGESLDVLGDNEYIRMKLGNSPRPEIIIKAIASYGRRDTFEGRFLTERPERVVEFFEKKASMCTYNYWCVRQELLFYNEEEALNANVRAVLNILQPAINRSSEGDLFKVVTDIGGYVFGVARIMINGIRLDVLKDNEYIKAELSKRPRPEITIDAVASYGRRDTFEDKFLTDRPKITIDTERPKEVFRILNYSHAFSYGNWYAGWHRERIELDVRNMDRTIGEDLAMRVVMQKNLLLKDICVLTNEPGNHVLINLIRIGNRLFNLPKDQDDAQRALNIPVKKSIHVLTYFHAQHGTREGELCIDSAEHFMYPPTREPMVPNITITKSTTKKTINGLNIPAGSYEVPFIYSQYQMDSFKAKALYYPLREIFESNQVIRYSANPTGYSEQLVRRIIAIRRLIPKEESIYFVFEKGLPLGNRVRIIVPKAHKEETRAIELLELKELTISGMPPSKPLSPKELKIFNEPLSPKEFAELYPTLKDTAHEMNEFSFIKNNLYYLLDEPVPVRFEKPVAPQFVLSGGSGSLQELQEYQQNLTRFNENEAEYARVMENNRIRSEYIRTEEERLTNVSGTGILKGK